jgi:hypothetical protein
MAHPSWGPGWPNCQSNRIKTLVRADGLRLAVRDELLVLVGLLIDGTERLGYDVKPHTSSGFACRQIFRSDGTPTGKPSNHSWGLAVDINSQDNPRRRPLTTNLPRAVIDLWKRHGFGWGGDFSTTPDPMHFEYRAATSDVARHTQQAQAEMQSAGPGVRGPAPPPFPGVVLKRGSRGNDVCRIQARLRTLGFAIDNVPGCPFGPQTENAVIAFQTQRHLGVDGKVGPNTWGALFS